MLPGGLWLKEYYVQKLSHQARGMHCCDVYLGLSECSNTHFMVKHYLQQAIGVAKNKYPFEALAQHHGEHLDKCRAFVKP